MPIAEASGFIEKVLDEPLKHLPPIIGLFGGLLVLILQTAFNDHLKKEQRGLLLIAMALTVWLGYLFGAKLLVEYAYSENITIGLLLTVIALLFVLAPLAGRLSPVTTTLIHTLPVDPPSSTPRESLISVAGEATREPNTPSDVTTPAKAAESRTVAWMHLWPPSARVIPRWVASLYVVIVFLLSIAATNHFALESNCILRLANPSKTTIVDVALVHDDEVRTLHRGVSETEHNEQYYRVVLPKSEFEKAKFYSIQYMRADNTTTSTMPAPKSEFIQSPMAFAFGEIWICHDPSHFKLQATSSPTPTPGAANPSPTTASL